MQFDIVRVQDDGRGYDILNPEQVDELKEVRVPFQFPALHLNFFHLGRARRGKLPDKVHDMTTAMPRLL